MSVDGNACVYTRVDLCNTVTILVKAILHRNGNAVAVLPDVHPVTAVWILCSADCACQLIQRRASLNIRNMYLRHSNYPVEWALQACCPGFEMEGITL